MTVTDLALLFNGAGLAVAGLAAGAAWRGVQEVQHQRRMLIRPFLTFELDAVAVGGGPSYRGWHCRVRNLGLGPALVGDRPFTALKPAGQLFEVDGQPHRHPAIVPREGAVDCILVFQNPRDGIPLLSDDPWPFTIAYSDMFGSAYTTRIELHPLWEVVLTQVQGHAGVVERRSVPRLWERFLD